LFTPLTKDELQSLCWIATMSSGIAIPAAHILKLLAAGYIQESMRGPTLTDLGECLLRKEMAEVTGSGGWG
jgi:hypothetical protein